MASETLPRQISSTSAGSRFDFRRVVSSCGEGWGSLRARTYLDDLLEQLEDEAIELGVLEASLLGLG